MSAEGDGGTLTPERLEYDLRKAAETFDVVRSRPDLLLIDLDTPEAAAQFERVLPKVRDHFGVERVETWPSKSGNTHAAVTLSKGQPIWVRLALQAALGSDGVREVLGLTRVRNGCEEPSALFRPKPTAPDDVWS